MQVGWERWTRASDTRLNRTVAIKVLPAHLASDVERRQRFEREARIISRLDHPHVCALYDVGHESGREFLVMQYLDGETLADRLKRGRCRSTARWNTLQKSQRLWMPPIGTGSSIGT